MRAVWAPCWRHFSLPGIPSQSPALGAQGIPTATLSGFKCKDSLNAQITLTKVTLFSA